MANMTRDEFVTELKARGWSRFTDADLQRYLNWALQDLYGKASYPRSAMTLSTLAAQSSDKIAFTAVSGASADLVQQITRVFVKYNGELIPVTPADEETFMDLVYPNTEATTPETSSYPQVYYVWDKTVFLYPKQSAAVDLLIYWAKREDAFAGGSSITGLPERFDKALLALAEVHCNRRAHDTEGQVVAQNMFDEFLLGELGQAGLEMFEEAERIAPWRG